MRTELGRGDLRALYLGWLLGVQSGDLDDDGIEPPVPAGLASLSSSLEGLIEFLRIDRDLVQAAAVTSEPSSAGKLQQAEIREWVARLPPSEKDDILARMIETNGSAIVSELVQRQRREHRERRGATTKEPKGAAPRVSTLISGSISFYLN